MDMDAAALSATPSRCPFDHTSAAAATAFTPSGDNFLLSSPYFHRLINNLATSADAGNPRSDPAPRSAIESLKEFTITTDSDASMLCPVCKDPFAVDSVVKVMPCEHTYHSDCIVPWLETNNSCPVCRYKLPVVGERMAVNEGEGYLGSVRFEELVDEVDLYGFRNTLRYIERMHRWNDVSNIGIGSEGDLLSPTQIGEVESGDGVLEREMAMSSWSRWQAEEIQGGTDETDHAFDRSWDFGEDF
ncbi:RING-type E3 ubiquitin transferase [Salvia divinorum]|uniref:RING-type E3 ubiquitin transferase n=1 Tax=Salvia divinorum TaxID=28513 RepID=A0ABD1I102_SALDI